ncbi:3'-5' exonuclease [Pseudalkalibacillus caeni]|uniref:Exonuclease n=1 Tax=Exobacillus caeni TaxID=2574798 RepID=A0A5R9F3P4_9BACL|nr:3'-5' exonuclease [Pseudalkalibacillus caeni]TLS36218.1 exonuclease [Pseudalkalibacillus caeni]
MDFIAIDFETANSSRASACSIGLVEYENDEYKDDYYTLIKPIDNYFSSMNTAIHGITAEDVKDAEEFHTLWDKEIRERLEGKLLVAHNASFDMSVLRNVLDAYNLPHPNLTYNCTVNISKKTWTDLENHKLNTIAKHLGIRFDHHHALEDAHVAAQVFMEALNHHASPHLDDLLKKTGITNGMISETGYTPARLSKPKPRAKNARSRQRVWR